MGSDGKSGLGLDLADPLGDYLGCGQLSVYVSRQGAQKRLDNISPMLEGSLDLKTEDVPKSEDNTLQGVCLRAYRCIYYVDANPLGISRPTLAHLSTKTYNVQGPWFVGSSRCINLVELMPSECQIRTKFVHTSMPEVAFAWESAGCRLGYSKIECASLITKHEHRIQYKVFVFTTPVHPERTIHTLP